MNNARRYRFGNVEVHEIIFDFPERLKVPYSWTAHIPFAFFLMEMLRPKVFVELGVHSGNSFNAFCQAVSRLNLNTRCYGVDSWEGDTHSGFFGEWVLAELQEYVNRKYNDFAVLLKANFDEALYNFEDKSLDLLHIDGMHTYEAVKKDFESWLPKMSDAGVIILHDTLVMERDFGVWKLWNEIASNYPCCNFDYGCGLGCVVIGQDVNSQFKNFIEEYRKSDIYERLFERLGQNIILTAEIEDKTRLLKRLPGKVTNLFINSGDGFGDENLISQEVDMESPIIDLEWDLTKFRWIDSIRWDPLENRWCRVKIESVVCKSRNGDKYEVDLDAIGSNGILKEDRWVTFETFDPMFFLPINGELTSLCIRGEVEIFDYRHCDGRYQEIVELVLGLEGEIQKKDEVIQKKEELINMKDEQIRNIFNSKSWRLIQGLRRVIPFSN